MILWLSLILPANDGNVIVGFGARPLIQLRMWRRTLGLMSPFRFMHMNDEQKESDQQGFSGKTFLTRGVCCRETEAWRQESGCMCLIMRLLALSLY